MNRSRRGFALLTVMMLVAVVAVASAVLLDVLQADIALGGYERSMEEAREIAEGAALEVIDDRETPEALPTLEATDLKTTYRPSSDSPFMNREQRRSYEASVALLRVAPLGESSINQARAMVYEITAVGSAGDDSTFEVRTQVFRPVAVQPGVVIPRRHAR